MNKIFYMFVFLLCCTAVSAADGCLAGFNCTWWAYTTENGFISVDSINITLSYPNGSVFLLNQSMTEVETGKYRYSIVLNDSGNYIGCMQPFNSSKLPLTEPQCETKEVRGSKMLFDISIFGIIIAIGLAFGFWGEYSKRYGYIGVGAAWYIAAGAFAPSLIQNIAPYITSLVFYGLAVAMIAHIYVSIYMSGTKKDARYEY